MTAKEYQELRLFCAMEPIRENKLLMGQGIDPETFKWKPDEQSEDELIDFLERG